MRYSSVYAILLLVLLASLTTSAKEFRDTLLTRQGDRIIVSYSLTPDGDRLLLTVPRPPRIIPSESLRKECKGDLTRLKTVVFDQVGNNSSVKWKGLTPSAFMVPAGTGYEKSDEGYYILGESSPLTFSPATGARKTVRLPVYIALYEKKRNYRIVSAASQPLSVSLTVSSAGVASAGGARTERIAVTSKEELEADNDDVANALGSIRMIRQLLDTETELPFSQTLTMEVQNLRTLKDRIRNEEVTEKINELFLDLNQKERELKEAEKQASLSAEARQQALQEQQKQEAREQQQQAEEKARVREEKQQKRTLWMTLGAIILAILGFVGNAVFKHFRDLRNQKNIMQMQESIARQAGQDATRRARELARNKAHQAVNRGKGKLRESVQGARKPASNSKMKSI